MKLANLCFERGAGRGARGGYEKVEREGLGES